MRPMQRVFQPPRKPSIPTDREEISTHLPQFEDTTRSLSIVCTNHTLSDGGSRGQIFEKRGLKWIQLDFKESNKKVGHALRDIDAHHREKKAVSQTTKPQDPSSDLDVHEESQTNKEAQDLLSVSEHQCYHSDSSTISSDDTSSESGTDSEICPELHRYLLSRVPGLASFIVSDDLPPPCVNELIDRSIFDADNF